jgi:hypothetical protein
MADQNPTNVTKLPVAAKEKTPKPVTGVTASDFIADPTKAIVTLKEEIRAEVREEVIKDMAIGFGLWWLWQNKSKVKRWL